MTVGAVCCETGVALLAGTVMAVAVGVIPGAGAAMGAVAALVTSVAESALRPLPDEPQEYLPYALVSAAWVAGVTQALQIFLRTVGYAVPFWGGAAIVSVAILGKYGCDYVLDEAST